MFWKTKSIGFAAEDVRTLVCRALPAIRQSVGEPVYITKENEPSLVTQSEVLCEVTELLDSSTEILDTTHIASELKLDRQNIDAVIIEAVKNSQSFFDGVHVLPSRRIDAVGNAVLSKQQITRLSEICLENRITLKAAEYAVKRKSPELIILDDFVVPRDVLNSHATRVQKELEKAQMPVRFAEIEPDLVLLPLVKTHLGFPAHQNEYLPPKYVEAKLGEAEHLLKTSGYVTPSVVNGIEDANKLAKRTNGVVLGSGDWVVSREFIATQRERIIEELNKHLFFDLRDLPLGPYLAKYIVENENDRSLLKFRSIRYPASYLVKPQLERELLSEINAKLSMEAISVSQGLDLSDANGSSTIADFVNRIELPSLATVTSLVEDIESIPSELRLAENILPQIRRQYTEICTKELQPRFEKAMDKLESKIRSYLNALATIPEGTELQILAWEEWQQYVSEHQFPVPSNLEIAQQQFQIPVAVVEETTQELRRRAESQLAAITVAPKNYALILHLAATIYHSRHFCKTSPGILKIRGKAIPKLVKQFEFPSSFDELRMQIKTASPELIAQVREASAK